MKNHFHRADLDSIIPRPAWATMFLIMVSGFHDVAAMPSLEPVPGKGVYQGVIATAINPDPDVYPSIGVWLGARDTPNVVAVFPNVPGSRVDGWNYEGCEAFSRLEDVRVTGENKLEIRQRFREEPHVVHLTTLIAEPGAVEWIGQLELDQARIEAGLVDEQATEEMFATCMDILDKYTPWHFGKRKMDDPGITHDVSPDLCLQVKRSPAFQSAPEQVPRFSTIYAASYYEYVKRCFIFTEAGRVFLDQTHRATISTSHQLDPGDPRDNPPATQVYYGVWQRQSDQPFYLSRTRYVAPVIGVVSTDGNYLIAQAGDSPRFMVQAWIDCIHHYATWGPEDVPLSQRSWRRKIYAMENDPEALLERVTRDFPDAMKLRENRVPGIDEN